MSRSGSGSKQWAGRVLAGGYLLHAAGVLADPQSSTLTAATSAEAGERSRGNAPVAEVVVTGSNVRSADPVNVVNLQVLDREQMLQSGARQVSDLLSDIPANTGSQLYNETGQLTGTAQVVLRGLGFSSTLTLLNGRRAGVAPLSDKSGADFVDINQFPVLLVERIDVLKDGASAIYGSEAVAGVVNIVTRKNFDGLEVSADYASSSNDAWSVNMAAGRRFDRGSLSLFATYYDQSGNVRTDFDWLMQRIGGDGVPGRSQLLSSNGYPGTYSRAGTNSAGRPVLATGAVAAPDPNCEAAGGVFRINDNGTVNRTTCNFDFAEQIGVIPEERRTQAFLQGDIDITERLKFFNETSGSRNVNFIFKQPGGYSNGSVVGAAAGNIFVPASAPFNFFVVDPANPNRITAIDPAQWNPAIHTAVPVVGNYRPEGIFFSGDKRQTNTYFRSVNGFDLSLAGDWHVTASHAYAHGQFVEKDPVRIDSAALNSLIASGQYNPFATSITSPTLVSPKDGASLAGNSEDVLDQVFYTSDTQRRTNQRVIDLSASGPVLELPSGTISFAVGAQRREQTLRYVPDGIAAQGLADAPATDAPFAGRQRVNGAYAEALIPIYEVVELQAAVRHEDYGGAVGSSTDPKVGARVNLLDGRLGFSGSWGTSFQAPTLTQGATSQAFQIINDPVVIGPSGLTCSSTATGNNVNVITSGGGLTPQSSRNYDFGIDMRPLDALTVGASYWHYDYSELIAAGQNGQSIVNGECVNGVFVDDPRTLRGSGGQLFAINTSYVNVGKVVTDGVDVMAAYRWQTDGWGSFQFRTDATRVNKFDVTTASGQVQHNAGSRNFNNNFAPMPQWRATARGVWARNGHEVSLGVRFTDGYRNDQSNNAPISSFTTTDLQYRLRLNGILANGDSDFYFGVTNVFDEAPPSLVRYDASGRLISGTVSDIDRPGYDPLSVANIQGRIFYFRLTQKF